MIASLLLIGATGLLYLALYIRRQGWKWSLPKGLPILPRLPGPLGLPLLGNIHQVLGSKPFLTFDSWKKQHGDVFFIGLGRQKAVVLNSIEAAREALVTKGKDFSGRPPFHTMTVLHGNERKFVFSIHCDNTLKTYRKTVLADMRRSMDALKPLVEDEVDKMAASILPEGTDSTVLDMRSVLHDLATNLAHGYAFGHTYALNDPRLADWGVALDQYRELLHWFRHENFIPYSHLFLRDFQEQVASFRTSSLPLYQSNIERCVEERDSRGIREAAGHGLLGTLVDIMEESQKVEQDMTTNDIISVLRDVMFGGSDGTYQPMTWMLIYVTQHPWVQDRLQEEIFDVLGTDRMPELSDRESMPFVEATIREVLRHSEITTLGIPRRSLRDVTIGGFPVAKDSLVIVNVFSIHRDSRHWKDPAAFDPERFLDAEGNLRTTSELSYLPFSTGHRSCVGQNIARAFLFLLFTRFFQMFHVKPAPGHNIPKDINSGGAFNPDVKPFKIELARNSS